MLDLQNKRLRPPAEELERLKSSVHIANRLETLEKFYLSTNSGYMPKLLDLMVYGRVLEILDAIKETHYVFTHGQASCIFLPVQLLIQETISSSRADHLLFETSLRHPLELEDEDRSVACFQKEMGKKHNYDVHHSKILLSADAYLSSTAFAESALAFLLAKSHRPSDWQKCTHTVNLLANHYLNEKTKKDLFLQKFDKHLTAAWQHSAGTLSAICLPKKAFEACAYLSGPVGLARHLGEEPAPILDALQNDEQASDEGLKAQVRILTHKLPKEQPAIFTFPALPDAAYFTYEQQVLSCIREFL